MQSNKIGAAWVLAALTALPAMAAGNSTQAASTRRLEGTWDVTAAFTDAPDSPFKVLFTFMPGRRSGEGTLVDTNEFQFTPNPICTPDQGVWERVGHGRYIATHKTFCFDQTNGGAPDGIAKVRDTIQVSPDGESFQMTQYVEAFDADGNLVFTGSVDATGQRMHAEAPPAN